MSDTTPIVIFIVVTLALMTFALIFGIVSTRRAVARKRAEGRAAVPYWHTETGLEDDRGIPAEPETDTPTR